MNLYEIDQAMQALVDPETGELMDYEAFSELQMDRDSKIENMALWIKNLTAEAKAIKEEMDNLQKRRKTAENRAEGLKRYLFEALDGEKFQTARCSISYRKRKRIPRFCDLFCAILGQAWGRGPSEARRRGSRCGVGGTEIHDSEVSA